METFRVRCCELLSEKRRLTAFARVRARAREVDRMARDISGRDEKLRERKPGPDTELRTTLRSVIAGSRQVVRIALFGNGQFGHGSRGPCRRKALIRALGLRCVVVLVDEFNTSKMCCGCESSRVFRFQSQTDGDSTCFIANDLGPWRGWCRQRCEWCHQHWLGWHGTTLLVPMGLPKELHRPSPANVIGTIDPYYQHHPPQGH
ncbi:unnamed protein product [Chrysoparadoxa australica]